MYEAHWNLRSRPFENRLEGEFYYPSEVHQAALLKLRYAIENRRSAAVLSGTSGMGKSMVLQSLQDQLPDYVAAMISILYPAMEPNQLIRTIANRLCGESKDSQQSDMAASIERIDNHLREQSKHGKHVIIAIDEAHLLEQYGLIEPLRLLLNLGTPAPIGESTLTLILCGQPTLLPHVQRNVSLDERIAVRCVLHRLALDETVAYIGHRIRSAGGHTEKVFDTAAMETVFSLTQGIPRRINRLCDLALMVGYAQERERITSELIEEVNEELTTPSLSME